MTAANELLLQLLRCPQCGSELAHAGESFVCRNGECRRQYAIRDEIPVMLVGEAQIVPQDAWQALVNQPGSQP
jgi:uncharacterized protein YbaR (Trm112 family)